MVFAFFRFRPKGTEVNSSKSYDRHLAFLALMLSGEGNPFFGKKHSPETRAKIVANHGMRGRTAYDIWVEKYGLEEARKMKVDLKARRSKIMSGPRSGMYGKVHSPEWRKNHSRDMSGANNPNFGKSYAWVNKDGQTKRVLLEKLDHFLTEGWLKGRAGSGAPFGRECTEATKKKRRATRLANSSL